MRHLLLLLLTAWILSPQTSERWGDGDFRHDRAQLFLRIAAQLYQTRLSNTMHSEAPFPTQCNWWWRVEAPTAESYSLGFAWEGGPRCGNKPIVPALHGYIQFEGAVSLWVKIFYASPSPEVARKWALYETQLGSRDITSFSRDEIHERWPELSLGPSDQEAAAERFESLRSAMELAAGNALRVGNVSPGAQSPGSAGRGPFGWHATYLPDVQGSVSRIACSASLDPVDGDVTEVFCDEYLPSK